MEAEYHGAMNVGTEVGWIQQLIDKLGFLIKAVTVIKCNNHSAIQVTNNHICT